MRHLYKILVLTWLFFVVVGLYLQHDVGLADNGDFTRGMTWFTSGPVEFESNWPDRQSQPENWSRRFFNYWLPAWKLDFPGYASMRSTSVLLWVPGVFLNYLLLSREVLYLTSVGLIPRLLLCLYLFLTIRLIEINVKDALIKTALLATSVGALSLLFVTTNYVAYLNSFYFETGSFIYLFAFLLSLVGFRGRPVLRFLAGLVSLCLLASAKASNAYWPALGTPFLLYSCGAHRKLGHVVLVSAGVLIATVLTAFAVLLCRPEPFQGKINRYQSLFCGAFTFSDAPSQRLAELGMADGMECIGKPAGLPEGGECLRRYESKLTFLNTVKVIAREPGIAVRMTAYAARTMQETVLNYLGKIAAGDPRQDTKLYSPPLNLWAEIKVRHFPRGGWLWLTLVVYGAVFLREVARNRSGHDFALVGLLATVATFVDMELVFLADGRADPIKHLFLSNVLFDVATIVFIGFAVAGVVSLSRWLWTGYLKGLCFTVRGRLLCCRD